jgi:DNA-binding CsgD family transcriptional regulator
MCAQGLAPKEEVRAPGSATEAETLVRQLVSLTERQEGPPVATELEGQAEAVCLDVKIDGFRCLLLREQPPAAAKTALSPREQEIARMIAEGYPNKTIAAVLDISSWTVGTHVRRVFAKLGVGTRAAMVARVIDDGLLKTKAAERHHDAGRPGQRLNAAPPRK